MPRIDFGAKADKQLSQRTSTTGTTGSKLTVKKKPVGRPSLSDTVPIKTFRNFLMANLKHECKLSGEVESRPVLEHVIAALFASAIEGNTAAQIHVLDRFYGKVTDKVQLSGDAENPLASLQRIEMVLVRPSSNPQETEVLSVG